MSSDESRVELRIGEAKLLSEVREILTELEKAVESGRESTLPCGRSWTDRTTGGFALDLSVSVRIRVAENGSTKGNMDLDQGIPVLERVDPEVWATDAGE